MSTNFALMDQVGREQVVNRFCNAMSKWEPEREHELCQKRSIVHSSPIDCLLYESLLNIFSTVDEFREHILCYGSGSEV